MNVEFIEEPELQFGVDRHVDIRFGVMNYHPFDISESRRPTAIKIGVVGTNESIEGTIKWLQKCRNEIPARISSKPNLYPKFPGFSEESPFRSKLVFDGALNRAIRPREFVALAKEKNPNVRIETAVGLFMEEIEILAEKQTDVIICAMPSELIEMMAQGEEQEEGDPDGNDKHDHDEDDDEKEEPQLVFHDLLKARAMRFAKPLQVLRPSTYDESKRKRETDRHAKGRSLQDEATRAWNFLTALYYKAGGFPWRMLRNETDPDTCFVGISFYRSLDQKKLRTSMAQVFNERGYGVVVRGGTVKVSKEDRQPHLSKAASAKLLTEALGRYKKEHKNLPARLVVHKTSGFNQDELDGCESAINDLQIDSFDLLSVAESFTRLFRTGYYPPLRGTLLHIDDTKQILYTRGSVDFYQEYAGQYVPKSLLIRRERADATPTQLATEILQLTKMNWNNTQFDSLTPITVKAARDVGKILKYVTAKGDAVQDSYRFYM
jgi:hypothetical protein